MLRDLAAQGVRHAEVYISIGILYWQARLDVDQVIAAIERGRIRAEADFNISLLWIIDAVRHFGVEACARVFSKAAELQHHYPSIVGIGIGGNELLGPAHEFRELYAEAKAAGLRLTCHAGENTGPQSIWAALNIGAERIGHALSAQDDPDLIEVLAERQIPLELNITSNLRTGCCPSLDDHPVRRYFEEGLMVTLNSDDPPFFGANLLDEYLLAHRTFEFPLDQLRELAANSIEASFLPPERKLALLARSRTLRLVAFPTLYTLRSALLPRRRRHHHRVRIHLRNPKVSAQMHQVQRPQLPRNLNHAHRPNSPHQHHHVIDIGPVKCSHRSVSGFCGVAASRGDAC